MKDQFRKFFDRLGPVLQQPDTAQAALAAGLVEWAANPPPEGTSERGGYGDIETGEGMTTTFFLAASVPPSTYPSDLPWLDDLVTIVAEFAFGGDVMRSISWADVPSPRESAERVIEQQLAAGWERVDAPSQLHQNQMVPEAVAWLQRGARTRVVACPTTPGASILQLIEWPLAQAPSVTSS